VGGQNLAIEGRAEGVRKFCERFSTIRIKLTIAAWRGGVLRAASRDCLDEGHELDRKWQVPKAMIERRLSQEEAKRLLAKFDH
jgi:hypothetical protein